MPPVPPRSIALSAPFSTGRVQKSEYEPRVYDAYGGSATADGGETTRVPWPGRSASLPATVSFSVNICPVVFLGGCVPESPVCVHPPF